MKNDMIPFQKDGSEHSTDYHYHGAYISEHAEQLRKRDAFDKSESSPAPSDGAKDNFWPGSTISLPKSGICLVTLVCLYLDETGGLRTSFQAAADPSSLADTIYEGIAFWLTMHAAACIPFDSVRESGGHLVVYACLKMSPGGVDALIARASRTRDP